MTRSSANGRLVRRRPSPNRAPPVPKCALERYGLIREQRNVIIVVIRLARSRSLALRLQMGTSLPPTSHVSRRASKCRVDQWSGLERSAIHSLAHRIAHSHCMLRCCLLFPCITVSPSPDHRDGLRLERASGGRDEWGLLGRWSHRAPTREESEGGDACTTVRAVNFMTLPSTGDKRRKRKKNGAARRRDPRHQVRDRQSVLPFGDTSAPKTTGA